MTARTDQVLKRKKDSARLVWDSKPRRAPNPRDIEFQTAEIVVPNPERDLKQLPFGFTGESLVVGKAGQLALSESEQRRGWALRFAQGQASDPRDQRSLRMQEIDKSKMNRLIWGRQSARHASAARPRIRGQSPAYLH